MAVCIRFILFLTLITNVTAQEIVRILSSNKTFTVCRVELPKQQLQLFWHDELGSPFRSFDALNKWLNTKNQKLVFAMNAGMYQPDFSPVGLCVQEGRELSPLNLKRGDGNFFLIPNGVFAVTKEGATIVESSHYRTIQEQVLLATQSGPLLVINGLIHPAFRANSDSRLFRNGVGVISPQNIVFAISEEPVNFYEFACLFRGTLRCKNALFFDGTVSSLYSAKLKRNDKKIDLGPIVGVTGELK